MGTISTSDFLIETKRIAKAIDLLQTGIGAATDSGTPGYGGQNALAAVAALGDNDQLTALLPAAVRLAAASVYGSYYYAAWYDYLKALNDHVGGINDYLDDNSLHIHYLCKAAYPAILAKHVFPPVTDFGSFALSGAGAGTWTAGDDVDTDSYGDGLVELVTESLIGGSDVVVTVTGEDFDGDTVQATATISSGTANDTTVAVNESTVRMASVSSVSVTGGTASDAFRVQTKVDRSPTGCS